ncbi:MAG: amidohydrolase family protein [Bacteroidetes bacterium]|nr:amidohydrolase family protein [Bacteroidota bacterium]
MSLYLKNATFINSENFDFVRTDLKIDEDDRGGIIFYPVGSPLPENCEIIDCSGKFVMKSFANGHHHIYSALATGMPSPVKIPDNFYEILKYIWWNLDKSLDKEMIAVSAMKTAIESAKNGVTFIIDHHSSPGVIEGSLEIIAQSLEIAGLSHLLCYEISDRDGNDRSSRALEETESYLQSHQGLVGLHASFTVSDSTFKKAIAIADKFNTGIHIHVAEDVFDQEHCRQNYNCHVIERIQNSGGLRNPKSVLGHCLHLTDTERRTIASTGTWVVQNTESNLNNKVGFFNSAGLGENIMLGTDGMHSDMIRSAKAAYFTGLNFDSTDPKNIFQRLRNVNRYLSQNGFKGDADNNLIVLDYPAATEFNQENFQGHFIYGLESRHIQHVIANGKLIVRDRKMTTLDEESIYKTSRELSKKLWAKMK